MKPRRYYRGLFTRCPRPNTLILTAPPLCSQPSSLAALARQLTCDTSSCLRLPVGKADAASRSCAPPSPILLPAYTALIDRWLQQTGCTTAWFQHFGRTLCCVYTVDSPPRGSTRQPGGSGEARSLERLALFVSPFVEIACNHGLARTH